MSDKETGNGVAEEIDSQMKGVPIFYEKPEILDSERHKDLGLIETDSFAFAAASNAIPINASEFPLACRNYPIVFIGDQEINAVAIVGLRKDENLMIESDGKWAQGTYIPAYVRRYPFIFVRQEGGTQYALCIDKASDKIGTATDKLFFDDKEKSEISEKAMEFCTLYQRHYLATEVAIKQLVEFDLLVPHESKFTLADGKTLTLKDFKIIDEKRLRELSDENFIALRKTGTLAAAYCHLVSMNSWQGLFMRAAAKS